MKNFKDKVAFITGGSSGIGFALAGELGRRGMRLMIAGPNQERLEAAAERLRQSGIEVQHVVCDVSDRAQVQKAALATIAAYGKVHMLLNNAGVALSGGFGSISETEWHWMFNVNVMGVIHCTEVFLPLLRQHGEEAHIANVGSGLGLYTLPNMTGYAASKFAVTALTEGWHAELAPQGIAVTLLMPGLVATNLINSKRNHPDAAQRAPKETAPAMSPETRKALSMTPEMFAARAMEGIEAENLYCLSHPSARAPLETRIAQLQEALTETDVSPASGGFRQ